MSDGSGGTLTIMAGAGYGGTLSGEPGEDAVVRVIKQELFFFGGRRIIFPEGFLKLNLCPALQILILTIKEGF